jgi:hypothetical protein
MTAGTLSTFVGDLRAWGAKPRTKTSHGGQAWGARHSAKTKAFVPLSGNEAALPTRRQAAGKPRRAAARRPAVRLRELVFGGFLDAIYDDHLDRTLGRLQL